MFCKDSVIKKYPLAAALPNLAASATATQSDEALALMHAADLAGETGEDETVETAGAEQDVGASISSGPQDESDKPMPPLQWTDADDIDVEKHFVDDVAKASTASGSSGPTNAAAPKLQPVPDEQPSPKGCWKKANARFDEFPKTLEDIVNITEKQVFESYHSDADNFTIRLSSFVGGQRDGRSVDRSGDPMGGRAVGIHKPVFTRFS